MYVCQMISLLPSFTPSEFKFLLDHFLTARTTLAFYSISISFSYLIELLHLSQLIINVYFYSRFLNMIMSLALGFILSISLGSGVSLSLVGGGGGGRGGGVVKREWVGGCDLRN